MNLSGISYLIDSLRTRIKILSRFPCHSQIRSLINYNENEWAVNVKTALL